MGQGDGKTTRGRKIATRTCGRTVRNGPRKGQECGQPAIRGTVPPACRHHLGGPQKRAEAAVRVELASWLPDETTPAEDPGDVLLRLVTQSAARVRKYAVLLAEAEAAAQRMQTALDHGRVVIADDGQVPGETYAERTTTGPFGDVTRPEHPAVQAARLDLERIFTTGGVAALVGYTFSDTKTGHIYATGEAIRALVVLEAQERDRCAKFAKLALDAGIAERQIQLAERHGALMEELLIGVLSDIGATPEQLDAVPAAIERRLALVAG